MNAFQRWIAPLVALMLMAASVWAQTAPYTAKPIQAVPPNITARDFPAMMMLAASRDHTLFGPMYTDYEDLKGTGRIDPTYRPDFDYYGYFDPSKCYSHDGQKFVPQGFRHATEGCLTPQDAKGQSLEGVTARWSGNFLNWATMTRIDVVRKMLYGGFRQTDTATSTVLQLAQLGTDAHAFAKYYRGTDIAKYTPFSVADLSKGGTYVGLTTCAMSTTAEATAGTPILRMVKGNYLLWSTTAKKVCRWRPAEVTTDAANADYWFGAKLVSYFERDAAIPGSDLQGMPSHALIAPYDKGTSSDLPPNIGSDGLAIRVQACASVDLIGKENCKRFEYKDANGVSQTSLKPSGILLDYGFAPSASESARAEFGLISGSYDNNLSGGVLRKNISNLNDEVNKDGTFCHTSGACSGGLIKSFDAFRLYNAGASSYTTAGSFSWVMPNKLTNKQFPSWGNPLGEMLIEALSYFANQGKSSYNNVQPVTIDSALGLPAPDWQDPLSDSQTVPGAGTQTRGQVYGKSLCRPMNTLAISSSALSFDRDEVGKFASLPNRSESLESFTDQVGQNEGINGTIRSVASVKPDPNNGDGGWGEQCTGKTVTHLWEVSGVCPEAPATRGSYLSAGAALYGNTRAIRDTAKLNLPPDLPGYALRVKTLAAAMGGGVARIEVVHPGTGAKVFITPESIWNAGGKIGGGDAWMPGAMLTIKLLNSISENGKTVGASYVVTWNDAQFGGDYDMDIVGYISYTIDGSQLKVTTDILNVDGGMPGSHGFSILGAVSNAGRYITHGSHGINFGDCAKNADGTPKLLSKLNYALRCGYDDAGMPTGAGFDNWAWPSKYGNTVVGFSGVETASTRTFSFDLGQAGSVLADPLWYAAKYGSFNTGEDKFSAVSQASLPSASADAEGYFLARDPAKLETGLRKALDKILAAGNSTPAVSSAQLVSDSIKYVAEFDAKAHTGSVKAYKLADGAFKKDPEFELGDKLTQASRADTPQRQVITNIGLVGMPLTLSALAADTPAALAAARTALDADAGADSWKDLVNYARGGLATGDLRNQLTNVLGPIVNAAPWLQRGAQLRVTDVDLPKDWASYRQFLLARSKAAPQSLLWVASNDSMLHAFNAKTGAPVLSYLPSPLMGGLRAASRESTKSITATMDGSPFTADVYLGAGAQTGVWKTYLFSSLGRGGKAVFALDVTDTNSLTEDNASSIFKWMFSSDDDADLGYVLIDPVVHRSSGQPANVVRLNNGHFALMLPNGYGSGNGRGYLYFLDVAGREQMGTWGGNVIKLPTDDATDNGLMGATWVDIDNNGTADWVYATDLKGRVWKFDISSTDPTKWGSAYVSGDTPVPLFQARNLADGTGDPLPITTAPVITFPGMGGVMVGFGTGKSILSGDFPKTNLNQRFYTVWDRGNFSTNPAGAAAGANAKRALPTMDKLVGRKLVRDDKTGAVTLADDAATSINWTDKDGWYLDFPVTTGQQSGTGEMVLSTPVVRSGVLFFTTVWPNGSAESMCQNAPFSTLYALSPTQGLAVHGLLPSGAASAFGVNVSDSKILVVSDQTVTPGAGKEALRIEGRNWEMSLSPNAVNGRVQWRVIPGLKTY
ncbi:pilus assembly protein [Aquabacterium sp.]|uniref:pilus assembly protein n=1 Tax=Aquabacterium sp. TaxID=1872578 RepID=UPI002E35EFB4|nr:PilC/PilY family type IV pilus protein [Aquabacterium sp.]HEX5311362.1 PilC/PilY family type IV pilus protein [Aquabacterium sp.]